MQKKIFLQKGIPRAKGSSGTGIRSHVKILLWAAVALIGLVVIAPLITSNGKKKEVVAVKNLDPDKGLLVREIPVPRAIQLMHDDSKAQNKDQIPREMFEKSSPPGAPAQQETGGWKPAELQPLDDIQKVQPPSQVPANDPAASQKTDGWIEIPKEEEAVAAKTRNVPVTEQKKEHSPKQSTVPQTGNALSGSEIGKPAGPKPSEKLKTTGDSLLSKPAPSTDPKKPGGLPAGVKPAKSTPPVQQAKALDKPKADAPKLETANTEMTKPEPPKAPAGSRGYSVQVGSFKDKANATEMKNNLEKKGYQVVVRTVNHPKHGELHVVQLKPVEDVAKASTLVEQIRHEEKVKPFVTPANEE